MLYTGVYRPRAPYVLDRPTGAFMAVTRSGVLGRVNTNTSAQLYVLFTVPANMTAIVKDVLIQNQDVAVRNVRVWAQNPADTIEGNLIEQDVPVRGLLHWQGWLALGPGDQFVVYTTTVGQSVNAWVSGAMLPGHL